MTTIELPYFDILLDEIARGKRDITTAFGRHVHWGYWSAADRPDGTMADFAAAAERLSARVCDAGGVADGQRVLDVGCGFGGTIAHLDARLERAELVGLNIDARQLARARSEVRPRGGNRIAFEEGDACAMPLPDASFDAVLAVECAFHFTSRARFFAEARRVLVPGGRLALCDFTPSAAGATLLGLEVLFRGYIKRVAGPSDVRCTVDEYGQLGRGAGLELMHVEDITDNTLPTYPVLRHIIRETNQHVVTAMWGTGGLEWLCRLGLLRYVVLAFEA